MNNSIIILDPSPGDAAHLKTVLEAAGFGYRCRIAAEADDIFGLLASERADIVLLDKALADHRTLRCLQKIKQAQREIRIYVLARDLTPQEYRRVQEYFVDGICQKEDDYPAMISTIEQAIE